MGTGQNSQGGTPGACSCPCLPERIMFTADHKDACGDTKEDAFPLIVKQEDLYPHLVLVPGLHEIQNLRLGAHPQ